MSYGLTVIFETERGIDEVAKFIRNICGLNLRRRRDEYQVCVCGVHIWLCRNQQGVDLNQYSNAGLHFNYPECYATHDFLTFSVTELVCSHFHCNAMIITDSAELLYEVHFNPDSSPVCIFKKATECPSQAARS